MPIETDNNMVWQAGHWMLLHGRWQVEQRGGCEFRGWSQVSKCWMRSAAENNVERQVGPDHGWRLTARAWWSNAEGEACHMQRTRGRASGQGAEIGRTKRWCLMPRAQAVPRCRGAACQALACFRTHRSKSQALEIAIEFVLSWTRRVPQHACEALRDLGPASKFASSSLLHLPTAMQQHPVSSLPYHLVVCFYRYSAVAPSVGTCNRYSPRRRAHLQLLSAHAAAAAAHMDLGCAKACGGQHPHHKCSKPSGTLAV